jgi:hypothetical protein
MSIINGIIEKRKPSEQADACVYRLFFKKSFPHKKKLCSTAAADIFFFIKLSIAEKKHL